MKNTLDLKPQIEAVLEDAKLALQAEIADRDYQDYLARSTDPEYEPEYYTDENDEQERRINNLRDLVKALTWWGENLQPSRR